MHVLKGDDEDVEFDLKWEMKLVDGERGRRSSWLGPFWFFGVAACIKLLLVPSYHSTDFEVHRHWLALTHSLSISQWYSDETSSWTLDYPPFFAYFEFLLSFPARLVDPRIVDIRHGLDYKSNSAVYFQRISVIVSDLSLLHGVHKFTKNLQWRKRIFTTMFVIWSPGLLIVDHIHFQYNGFLLGLLLLSLSYLREGRDLMGGFVFAALLCFKHLFAAAAPIYFFYLLRHYCWKGLRTGSRRLLAMGAVVMSVFAAAYAPFAYLSQMGVVMSRMFPFGRGLCHAYWAPNIWVFYIILDKVLASVLRKIGVGCHVSAASFTGGLVGNSPRFSVLPQVSALATIVLVLLALCPCIIKIWRNPQPKMTPRWMAYAYTCAFLFGWHVHEKASLHFVIPLALVAFDSLEDAKHYFLLSIVSCYSLFPLLYDAQEYPIKVVLLLLQSILMWLAFSTQFSSSLAVKEGKHAKSQLHLQGNRGFRLGLVANCYLAGLVLIEAEQLLHPRLFGEEKLPFLPLLLNSTYCAMGILVSWSWQLWRIIKTN